MKFTRRRRAAAQTEPGRAVSVKGSASGPGKGCLAVFFGIFLLAGLGFMTPFALAVWGSISARGWEEVDCTVISSGLAESSDSDGTTYRIEISYEYDYRGENFTSDRYSFLSGMSSSGYAGKKRVVDRYAPGSGCRAWVDPKAPSRAVLDRGLSATMWFALIPFVFVLIGGGGVLGTLGLLSFGWFGRSATRRHEEATQRAVGSPGPLVLEPSVGPVAKVVGTLVIATLWNGLVGVFVYLFWREWQRGGEVSWFMALFLVPFILVGLAILVAIPYVVLQAFNPRATLELAAGSLALGDEIDLRWRLRGRASRLRRLTLRLHGQESASYTVGTNTRTVTSTFHDEILFDTQHGQAMSMGSARLRIPADSMHSYDFGRNKIVWTLKLHGDIPRWPDVDDSYAIEIGPRRESAGDDW